MPSSSPTPFDSLINVTGTTTGRPIPQPVATQATISTDSEEAWFPRTVSAPTLGSVPEWITQLQEVHDDEAAEAAEEPIANYANIINGTVEISLRDKAIFELVRHYRTFLIRDYGENAQSVDRDQFMTMENWFRHLETRLTNRNRIWDDAQSRFTASRPCRRTDLITVVQLEELVTLFSITAIWKLMMYPKIGNTLPIDDYIDKLREFLCEEMNNDTNHLNQLFNDDTIDDEERVNRSMGFAIQAKINECIRVNVPIHLLGPQQGETDDRWKYLKRLQFVHNQRVEQNVRESVERSRQDNRMDSIRAAAQRATFSMNNSRSSPRPRVSRENEERPIEAFATFEEEDEMSLVGQVFERQPDPATLASHPLVVGTGRVGVELEVEGFPNPPRRMRYWSLHQDGSLRNNGIEFVFSSPLGGQDIFAAISELDSLLFNSKPDLNIRCSTHVHVDVRDMTIPQIKRFFLAYAYYEAFLFRQSGFYRFKSNFCVPLAKAEGMVEILSRHWSHGNQRDFLRYVQGNWDKYCSINMIPMGNYGSVEFRMSEAKSRKGQMLRLVNRFLALKELAMGTDLEDTAFLQHIRELPIKQVFRKGLNPRSTEIDDNDFKTGWMIANDICNRSRFR